MTFKKYRYTGERDVINKELTFIEDLTGKFKDDTQLIRPTLILAPGYSVNTSNYFIIKGYNYFVNNVTCSQQRLLVELELDDLETYKDQILNQTVELGRSTNKFNAYQIDNDMPQLNSDDITVTRFPVSFTDESYILITAGGPPVSPVSP